MTLPICTLTLGRRAAGSAARGWKDDSWLIEVTGKRGRNIARSRQEYPMLGLYQDSCKTVA
jgi:hypothetical protein